MPSRCCSLTGPIEALDDRARGAHHGRVESRHAQTALFLELHPVALDELRVDHHDQARPDRGRARGRRRRSAAATPICGAASPIPGAAYIVSIMSSTRRSTSAVRASDAPRRLVEHLSPYLRIGRIIGQQVQTQPQRPQSTQRGYFGKVIDDPLDPPSTSHFTLKLIKSPTLQPDSRKIGNQLRAMHGLESFDRFYLDDDLLFNQQIDPVATVERSASVDERERLSVARSASLGR